MLNLRKSADRGQGEFGWLSARYSFSFSNYYDPDHTGFGDLLVMNEDIIDPAQGFAPHPHRNMEIITYPISGAIEHEDSKGNKGVVRPGEIQYMSAGSGIVHSEMNHEQDKETKLLQIWIRPDRDGIEPAYGQHSFAERRQKNGLTLIASPDEKDGSIKLNQNARLYSGSLNQDRPLSVKMESDRKYWVQMVRGKLQIEEHILEPGDGLAIEDLAKLDFQALEDSEFLYFDLRKDK